MKSKYSIRNRNRDLNIERFRIRLMAKFCVVIVSFIQIVIRLIIVFCEQDLDNNEKLATYISLPFLALLCIIPCFEFFLFRKIGPRVMNYSNYFDMVLLITFTGEWIATLCTSLAGTTIVGETTYLDLTSVFGFTSFAWRTIFLLFLAQSWILIILPPVAAVSVVMGFTISKSPGNTVFILLRGIAQIINIILMMYFIDKIKWKEVFTNVQQEKWMQINDFILNNLPENIVILELGGQAKFVSDYCKNFMRKAHLSQDASDLFTNIKELTRLPDSEPASPENPDTTMTRPTERLSTLNILLDPTGNPPLSFERASSLEELVKNFKNIIKEYNIQERQFLLYNGKLQVGDHHARAVEIKVSYIQHNNKDYMIILVRDTTSRDLLVTLKDNNKYKDQLLASVSHELRAPLNGTINLVESAIQNISVPDQIKEKLLTPALRSSRFLLNLINDILDMSQIKAQKLRLIFKSGKLAETLGDTLLLVELQAKKKGVELILNLHPDVKEHNITTDHVRLSQIVLNLLNNATKFTKQGSVILSAMPTDDPLCIKISVQDSGIGMTEQDIKKLFSDYTHIECAERKEINPTGVGLGLNIAYNLSKLLGPKDQQQGITVESILNIGSTFSFIVESKEEQLEIPDLAIKKSCIEKNSELVPDEFVLLEPKLSTRLHQSLGILPTFQENERPPPSPEKVELKGQCQCAKILVVDDNPFNTMAFEAVLGSLKLRCDSVFDGKAAIDKILERQKTLCREDCRPYSVIFMDQEMPGMTGSETVIEIRRLQSQHLLPGMKIIGCTGHGSDEEVGKFMESGIDSCIQKPITSQDLKKFLSEEEL